MVIQLAASGGGLVLRFNSDYWCEVNLILGDRTVRLGADDGAVVIRRLAAALEAELEGDLAGVIDGVKVVWILTLAEAHGTVFAGDEHALRALFFQESSGSSLGSVRLNPQDCSRWRRQIQHSDNSEQGDTASRNDSA